MLMPVPASQAQSTATVSTQRSKRGLRMASRKVSARTPMQTRVPQSQGRAERGASAQSSSPKAG